MTQKQLLCTFSISLFFIYPLLSATNSLIWSDTTKCESANQIFYGTSGGFYARAYGGFSEHEPGVIFQIDVNKLGLKAANAEDGHRQPESRYPGGTVGLIDVVDDPEDLKIVSGVTFNSNGNLYGTINNDWGSFEPLSKSELVLIDPSTGTSRRIGEIKTADGDHIYTVAAIAFQPETDLLYLATYYDSLCTSCLFVVDTMTAEATLIKSYEDDEFEKLAPIGGLTFTSDGTLYMNRVGGLGGLNGVPELFTINPDNGEILTSEEVRLEQKFTSSRGRTISVPLIHGLVANEKDELIASQANGGTSMFKRVRGVIIDEDNKIEDATEQWVWRSIGDMGEYTQDLAINSTDFHQVVWMELIMILMD